MHGLCSPKGFLIFVPTRRETVLSSDIIRVPSHPQMITKMNGSALSSGQRSGETGTFEQPQKHAVATVAST